MTVLKRRNQNEFGSAVSGILRKESSTQAWLAKEADLSQAYVSDVLNGRRSASGKWADLVADALKLQEEERRKLHILAARDNGFDIELPELDRT